MAGPEPTLKLAGSRILALMSSEASVVLDAGGCRAASIMLETLARWQSMFCLVGRSSLYSPGLQKAWKNIVKMGSLKAGKKSMTLNQLV